jgi:orotate phosphoribosyltransferase
MNNIARALLEINAVGFSPRAPVTFKSGLLSPVYVDNRRIPFWPAQWRQVIDGFQAVVAEHKIDFEVLAGIETGGIPHSAALAYAMGKPSVFVRKQPKEHGTRSRIEGGDVAGRRVLLIEDLVTTGGSSLAGVRALREDGAAVDICLAIVSYEFPESAEAFERAGVRLYTLTSFAAILKEALAMGRFNEEEQSIIEDWLHHPANWAKKHGHQ